MDGAQNRNTRSDWYDLLYPRISSLFTRSKIVHNARRKVWESALNNFTLPQHYRTILIYVRTLIDLIDSYSQTTIDLLVCVRQSGQFRLWTRIWLQEKSLCNM